MEAPARASGPAYGSASSGTVNNYYGDNYYGDTYYNTRTRNYYGNSGWYNGYGNCGWNNYPYCAPAYCGSPWYAPGWYGGSGFSIGFGYNSWSGWNVGFGFGWSSGWGSGCAPYYTPYYSSYYAPYCAPVFAPWTPVYVAPVYSTPFYSYPATTVVVTNYVERIDAQPVAANLLLLDSPSTTYVLPTSQSMAAWSALNSGDGARALQRFQEILQQNPTDDRAQMGQGIAAMLQGDDQLATVSFRLALGTDAAAAQDLPISAALAEQIRRRAEDLWSQPYADAAFVSAVGYTVIREPQLAFRVAARAIELGDSTPVTAQLRHQLSYAMGSGS